MPNPSQPRPGSGRPVYLTILLPLLALLLVEVGLLVGGISLSGVIPHLDQNARDILTNQTQNRAGYLGNTMVRDWSTLSQLSGAINAQTQAMLDAGVFTLDELEHSSDACAPLLLELMEDLTSTLYAKRVNSIFVVFNTQDLSAVRSSGAAVRKTGIYLRDMDPTAFPSARNADLLLARAPIAVVRSLNISTAANWQPLFSFNQEDGSYYDFLFQPFQAAYEAQSISDAADYGYWSSAPFLLQGDALPCVSYSVPLVLNDGTVYGVLGVDVQVNYLQTMLPHSELFDDNQGSYLLAVTEEDAQGNLICTPILFNSTTLGSFVNCPLLLTGDEEGNQTFTLDGETYHAAVEFLPLYNSNAPFESQRWALIGTVQTDHLYAFSRQVQALLIAVILLTLIAGVTGSLIIGRRFSRPIRRLSQEVDAAQQSRDGIPRLSLTGIREIDRFSTAISDLSRDVISASTRFLRIMEMASVDLGGFEVRSGEDAIFVTDNFFHLLGIQCPDPSSLTVAQFRALMLELDRCVIRIDASEDSVLYQLPVTERGPRYVHVKVTREGNRTVGLAEDVTAATTERLRIEHERDYDLLTGLLNRRAFYRLCEELFHAPERLGQAALVMLDLDNLKSINDRFGHDWGDQYIRQAGQCFAGGIPPGTLCSRVSGDEFFLFFYGYQDQEDIRAALHTFSQAVRNSAFPLPSGERSSICVSGGVAWYPDDSTEFSELMKYSDFAMYQVKQTCKGSLGDFDLGVYNRESYLMQSRRELLLLLEQEQLAYHFQPIVDAATGAVRGYEALMRVNMPTLRSPDSVLKLAAEQGRLQEVERLTWYKASECYQNLLDQGLVDANALIFVNSIASQCMTPAECNELSRRYPQLQSRYVIEITEEENLDLEITRSKRETPGFSGLFALDDYGSGYNSEKNLLTLNPQFIKVDISITRGIDSDPDKQSLVSNLISYARPRGMSVIAEGLETADEVRQLLTLGVDLLQGYFLARPAASPLQINPAALDVIGEFHRQAEDAPEISVAAPAPPLP